MKDDTPITQEAYFASFPDRNSQNDSCQYAFEQTLDIRKFEIGLYWKRAQYFWTFIAASFAGYAVVLTAKEQTDEILLVQYAINCLGLVFSVAWYFVNRGSKFWQLNWEKHTDMLEDKVVGPLFKTTIYSHPYTFGNLVGPFPFSVTKINHIINLYTIAIWLFLATRYLVNHGHLFDFSAKANWNLIVISLLTLATIFAFFQFGVGSRRRSDTSFVQNAIQYVYKPRDEKK